MKNGCLYPKCKAGIANLRGLCRKHYNQAAKAISRGTTTWDDLVNERKANRNSKRGPKVKNRYFETKGNNSSQRQRGNSRN